MENKQVESVVPNGGLHCGSQSLVTYVFVSALVVARAHVCKLMS